MRTHSPSHGQTRGPTRACLGQPQTQGGPTALRRGTVWCEEGLVQWTEHRV